MEGACVGPHWTGVALRGIAALLYGAAGGHNTAGSGQLDRLPPLPLTLEQSKKEKKKKHKKEKRGKHKKEKKEKKERRSKKDKRGRRDSGSGSSGSSSDSGSE
ncbi:hypothetical protein ABPG77_010205 [Micractinium sp. CCAP 211/92]